MRGPQRVPDETGDDVVRTTGTARRAGRAVRSGDDVTTGPGATGPEPGDLIRVLTTDAPDPTWVDARPFRAHLRHLMSVGSLDATEAAVVLGLSTSAVRHLLEGRSGRAQRRISPQTARRLLLVRAADGRALRWSLTPSATARAALRRLVAEGWSAEEVAAAVGFGLHELAGLESSSRCSRLLAVRVVGLARRLPGTVDDEDLDPLRSAA